MSTLFDRPFVAYRLRHIVRELAANMAMAIPMVREARTKRGRTTVNSVAAQAVQMRDQFAFFMGTLGSVQGKTIIEIGPGDTIALGAQFLKAGAEHYIAFDRFNGDVFGPAATALYRELGCTLPDLHERVTVRRISIEHAAPENEVRADIVISFGVVEHLVDPKLALRKMAAMLAPDGLMVHRVDYGPHDIWRTYSNGLTFLTVPDWLWFAMGSNRGYSSRVRHAELIRTLADIGFHVRERVTRHFTQTELDQVRGALLPRFRKASDDELLVLLAEFACSRDTLPTLGPAFPY